MLDNNNIPNANELAEICLRKFDTIGRTVKPVDGKEWTVLSCIVRFDHSTKEIDVVSLGTGTKCIPKNVMNDRGDILNDSHAEIMCRRGFLRYLYEQIESAIPKEASSIFIFDEEQKKFKFINDDFSFHLFTTHSPCGDASIFPTAISDEDSTPAKKPKLELNENMDSIGECLEASTRSNENPPNANFSGAKIIYSEIGVAEDLMVQTIGKVRTKPGRGDPTLSMSCSDKLAKWNVLGIQGALLYQLIERPIYLSSITFCDSHHCDIGATERALWKRFTESIDLSNTSMAVMKPKIQISNSTKFKCEKDDELDPSPSSIVWCKVRQFEQQAAVAGKRQGVTKKNANTRKGRLLISKVELFREYLEILKKLEGKMNIYENEKNLVDLIYSEAKQKSGEYQRIWTDLRQNYFKVWTVKPNHLLQFKVD